MANRESKSARSADQAGRSPDPFMRAFLRQAVAIIAAERGINESSHSKLRAVAAQLGLSDDAFASALEKLKQPQPATGLNRYESAFVEYLRESFEPLRGDVLSIRSESKAVELAASRYQIDSVRAHQLIQKTATECEVATISHADAREFAEHLIEEAVGNRLWYRGEQRQQLHRVCRKWGLTEPQVDLAISRRLAHNRWGRRRRMIAATSAVLIMLVAGVAGWYAIQAFDWSRITGSPDPDDVGVGSVASETAAGFPDWWTPQLRDLAAQWTKDSRCGDAVANVLAADPEDRRQGIENLISLSGSGPGSAELHRLISGLYFLDPNPTTAKIVDGKLESLLWLGDRDSLPSPTSIRRSAAGARLLAMICETSSIDPINSKRAANATALFRRLTGRGVRSITESGSDVSATLRNQLEVHQWQNLLRIVNDSDEVSNRAFDFVAELSSAPDRPATVELRSALIMVLLKRRDSRWNELQHPIRLAIRSANPELLAEWIDLATTTTNGRLAQFLIRELEPIVRRLQAESQDQAPEVRLRRFRASVRIPEFDRALNSRPAVESIAGNVRKLIQQFESTRSPNADNDAGNILLILENVVHANNVALAWLLAVEGRARGFDPWSRLEELAASAPENELPTRDVTVNRPVPSASSLRSLRELVDRLVSSEPRQFATRMTAIGDLAELQPGIPRLDYSMARQLADHALAASDPREVLQWDRHLPRISRWIQFRLAVADAINDSDVQLDRALTVVRRIGIPDPPATRPNWRESIRRAILTAVVESEDGVGSSDAIRNNQERKLVRALEVRAKLLGATRLEDGNSGIVLLRAVANFQTDSGMPTQQRWSQAATFAAAIDDKLSGTIFANQILAEKVAATLPAFDWLAESRSFRSKLSDHELQISRQLLASEQLLSRVLYAHREYWIRSALQ